MGDADIETRRDHRVTGLETPVRTLNDNPRHIDAADTGETTNDLAGTRGRQRILVIDARRHNADRHLTGVQRLGGQRREARFDLAILLFNQVCLEGFHTGSKIRTGKARNRSGAHPKHAPLHL